jgi:hypothetical protein
MPTPSTNIVRTPVGYRAIATGGGGCDLSLFNLSASGFVVGPGSPTLPTDFAVYPLAVASPTLTLVVAGTFAAGTTFRLLGPPTEAGPPASTANTTTIPTLTANGDFAPDTPNDFWGAVELEIAAIDFPGVGNEFWLLQAVDPNGCTQNLALVELTVNPG